MGFIDVFGNEMREIEVEKGWTSGSRKSCGINGTEGVHRVKIVYINWRWFRRHGRKKAGIIGSNVGY